jgi:SAM-dependent methyltransferase
MLQLAEVSNRDTVYDIGCGDGRILILAAQQFGAAGVGIELDPELAKASADAVRDKGLQDRVRIVHGDATGLDVADATVLTVYLSERGNKKLLDGLCNLQPGVRVVSLYFPVKGWGPQLVKVGRSHNIEIFLYKVQQQQQQQP